MTHEEYYEDDQNHGSYQYVSLKDVIDDIELEANAIQDSLMKGIPRFMIAKYAIDGLREMNASGNSEVLALQLEIGSDLKFILPPDFVDLLKIFVVSDSGELFLLEENNRVNTSKSFLQDHEFNVVFDNEGYAVEVDALNVHDNQSKSNNNESCYRFLGRNFWDDFSTQTNIDTSKLSKNGHYTIDKNRDVISFSSNMLERQIVVTYISDGIQSNTIEKEAVKVHKHLITALGDYIYWRSILRTRNISQSDKTRARNTYLTSKHRASILLKDFSSHKINKAMRSAFKPLKF